MASKVTQVAQNLFRRAQRGLYGGKKRRTGNTISFSHRKTRRIWLPNVQVKNLHSDLLQETFSVRLTTHVLRCIDKYGGLDNYLLFTKPDKMDSLYGNKLASMVKDAWEKKNGKQFSRSQLLFNFRQEGINWKRSKY